MEVLSKAESAFPYTDYTLNILGRKYRQVGISALQQNKVAVVILAGGQGSKLGSDAPKGCFMLPIDKSLFELHVLNVKNVMRLHNAKIHIIIMTSSYTHDAIVSFFESHNYFGLEKDFICFTQQTDSMCFDFDDQPMKDDNGEFVMAPNGNGSVFETLMQNQIYEKLPDVEYYNIFSVDNALARIADPVFIGYMIEENLECASKTVTKREGENVGVFVKRGDVLLVKEYSEIKNSDTKERNQELSGKMIGEEKADKIDSERETQTNLGFDQGNICNHLFTKEFLIKAADASLPVHKAEKAIPVWKDGKLVKPNKKNGYKSELFIFDIFEFSFRNGIMNVPRELEFSPVKNSTESKHDNPNTAVNDLYIRSHLMLKTAGVSTDGEKVIIWPSESVFGENLRDHHSSAKKYQRNKIN